MADRNETCPTCGSKDAPRVCCPGTHAPDDHDSTCEPCWDPWHAATPAPRCPYFSRAWGVRCDRPAGHDGACQSSGDVFASGYIPDAAPPPAPRDETPTDGEVVLWREDRDGSWHAESDLIRDTGRSIIGRKYIAVPAAQRQRERDVIEELFDLFVDVLAQGTARADSDHKTGRCVITYDDGCISSYEAAFDYLGLTETPEKRWFASDEFYAAVKAKAAALRRGERKED